MENYLEDQLSMYQKVQGTLSAHAAQTAVIPQVAIYKAELDTRVANILALASTASTDITGYTVDKQQKRTDLKAKIRKISTGMVAYAAVNSNTKLLEKCDETESAMDAMRDNDFYTYSKLIINEATPIMTSLVPFGVVAADLTNATTASATYLGVIQNPRVQINERSKTLSELEELVADTSVFLKEKMDKVMGVFSVTNPGIHVLYTGSRSIDNTGAVAQPDYKGTATAGNITAIAEIPHLSSRSFEFNNTGTVVLQFALSKTPMAMEGNVVTLQPGTSTLITSLNLNPDTQASRLYVQNGQATDGKYTVSVLE